MRIRKTKTLSNDQRILRLFDKRFVGKIAFFLKIFFKIIVFPDNALSKSPYFKRVSGHVWRKIIYLWGIIVLLRQRVFKIRLGRWIHPSWKNWLSHRYWEGIFWDQVFSRFSLTPVSEKRRWIFIPSICSQDERRTMLIGSDICFYILKIYTHLEVF